MKLLNNAIIFDAALEHAFTLQSLISTRYFVTGCVCLIIVMFIRVVNNLHTCKRGLAIHMILLRTLPQFKTVVKVCCNVKYLYTLYMW